jgi:hypothetical protein
LFAIACAASILRYLRRDTAFADWECRADEEIHANFCTALGGVARRIAGRYVADPRTVGRSEYPIPRNPSPDDRR